MCPHCPSTILYITMVICDAGMTPLIMACNRRNSAIAKMFISANAIVNLADAKGNLPLHYIARCGDVDVARLLLDAGTYPLQFTNQHCHNYHYNYMSFLVAEFYVWFEVKGAQR